MGTDTCPANGSAAVACSEASRPRPVTTPAETMVTAGTAGSAQEVDPRRWWMLPVILIGSFLSFLDFFIVNIALPAMRADLHATPAELQFVVAAYGVGFGVTLIIGGRLGDIFGRKRMFMLGIGSFTLASLFCGIAPNAGWLIAARVLQAITAATVTPQVLGMIRSEFPTHERPTAIGLYGTSMGLASIMGQVLGGFLVGSDLFGWSWRLIFLVNLPLGLAALSLAAGLVRESRGDSRPTLDWGGVGLASLGLFLLIYPVVAGREAGWPAWAFAMLACVTPVLVTFILHERRVIRAGATPLIALHLVAIPTIRLGLLASVAFFLGLGVFFVVMTVTFQAGFGYSPFQVGLLFPPFAVGFSLASAASGRVTARLGPRILNLGTGLMVVGLLALLAMCRAGFAVGWVAAALVVYGMGQGLTQPALINTVIGGSGISADDTGSAVGLFLTTAQSCIAFGVAAIGDVFFARLGAAPGVADYLAAASATLWCNVLLLAGTFLLALRLPLRRRS
jgi:EmrB/QacA subfamily drug resistance transporter